MAFKAQGNNYGDTHVHGGDGDVHLGDHIEEHHHDHRHQHQHLHQHQHHNGSALADPSKACRQALYLTDPETDREALRITKGRRTDGTCEWLLQNETYLSWIRGDVPCLWISGDPGKGKTMLSIFLTEELERHTRGVGAQLLFLFCSSQDEKRNKATAVLRGLVHQLITKRPDLFPHVAAHFEDENRSDTVSSAETLWILLGKLLHAPALGRVFCVLDGLDECDDDSSRLLATKFCDFFASKKAGSTTGNFQLAIVSRRIRGLDAFPKVRLDPDNVGHVDSDIQKFISDRVRELRKVDGFNDTLRNAVEKTLLARSHGTFLWVGFVMAELCNKSTPTEIMATLEDLPSGLPAIYDRMLLRTDKSRRAVITKALRWVTLAVRPLTLRELAAVTGVQPAVAGLSSYQSVRDLVTWCGPILKIHNDTVGLIHQSAKDYLLRQTSGNGPDLQEFRISAEEAHAELTRTCLDCLERSGLQQRSWDDFEIWGESDLEKSPLLLYATLYWAEHARLASTHADRDLVLSRPFLEKRSRLRANWWNMYIKYKFAKWEL